MSCLFCKIANGELPSFKLYEDDEFVVILDKFPSVAGHSLVIPKTHAKNIFDIDNDLAARAFALAAKVASKIKAGLDCDGINVLQNNGEVAGQSIEHLHIHIIPRYANDDIKLGWQTLNLDDNELTDIQRSCII